VPGRTTWMPHPASLERRGCGIRHPGVGPAALGRPARRPIANGPASEGGDTMPRTRRRGLARTRELPGTLKRSSREAHETFTKAHDSAVQAYGAGDQADRATYAEFKRKFEKRGDHWIPRQSPVPET